ncbi:APC family amino acid-polyamine-organocation transporter [Staphylococcus aureus T59607]|uniref:APC family permease n=1 Tax=Staphylococcus aureus TaxID=1280 RepID=UPI0004489A4B|nr:APC family permease [Staphylococcus aureus]EVV00881.1 APC family amino acid-polyamine-organocation transporter [Staphylococcus aureus T59607]EVZ66094.1 APC family amino acid-polyamine-organocation transporter [Staphylococcus aureus F77930]EWB35898.1 APC family amino acid-polyamine-organocation transporter [Staphylococcus aureus W21940]EWI37933.1 APC family amino acid-polyamine-organocation transporter [Staphylococcus aureus W50101]EWX01296.1 APC family amino acid-polyamine-organocation tran
MFNQFKRLIIGQPKKNRELKDEKISKFKGLAILSSDALSSVAYGPEQILITLSVVGAVATWYTLPIAGAVLILLAALIMSYRQIIYAYPKGGGAYMVSKTNLGEKWGLLAGGSLLVDYILTVAVSISSGADAFVAAFPSLYGHKVLIACLLVLFILILNLRGLTESATVLSYPVYLFIIGLVILIFIGTFRVATGDIQPHMHASVGTAVPGVTLFLLLKAFSSGASSLTGVEAISNAVTNFREPSANNAAFYFVQATTVMILVLAANTGFTAFPMLAASMSKDKYMPRMFTVRGDRLGYSNSIIILGVLAIILIIVFDGMTEDLIPLYAVGVFIPFTLAQFGMVIKWIHERPKNWLSKLSVNLLGGIVTFIVFMILLITKFSQVWPILIFLPFVVIFFLKINKHYRDIAEQLRSDIDVLNVDVVDRNLAIVPITSITTAVDKSIYYAQMLANNDVIAVHVSFGDEDEKAFQEKWKRHFPDVRLVILHSEYRSIIRPISRFIDKINRKANDQNYMITVVIPEFITKKRWHNLLHNQTSLRMKLYLIYQKNVNVCTIPFKLKK